MGALSSPQKATIPSCLGVECLSNFLFLVAHFDGDFHSLERCGGEIFCSFFSRISTSNSLEQQNHLSNLGLRFLVAKQSYVALGLLHSKITGITRDVKGQVLIVATSIRSLGYFILRVSNSFDAFFKKINGVAFHGGGS
ncbi:hypothetical protein Tco_0899007 [Tanacetum coccineum]